MPIALLALTLSAFAIGTTEFVIVGLLPTVATDLGMGAVWEMPVTAFSAAWADRSISAAITPPCTVYIPLTKPVSVSIGIWRATVSPRSASMLSFFRGTASELGKNSALWAQSIACAGTANSLSPAVNRSAVPQHRRSALGREHCFGRAPNSSH